MLKFIWIHLEVIYEPPWPSRLFKETWSKGGFLTGLPMLDLDENFTGASQWYSHSYDPNLQVYQEPFCHEDSRKRHLGKVESWQGSWCWIIIKILQKLHKDAPIHLTRSPLSRFIRNLHIPKDSTWNSEIGLWWNFSIICQGLSGAFMSLNAPEGD